jgi:hypothetical protein
MARSTSIAIATGGVLPMDSRDLEPGSGHMPVFWQQDHTLLARCRMSARVIPVTTAI